MGVLYRPVSAIAVVLTNLYLTMPGKKKAPRVQSDTTLLAQNYKTHLFLHLKETNLKNVKWVM